MTDYGKLIKERVHQYYWGNDINCATTVIKILAEVYKIQLEPQVIDSALGMHGAGKFGAQCGLVEGSLMFMGIYGKKLNFDDEYIVENCHSFAQEFQNKFGSIVCKELRPLGFSANNPPHLCEELTKKAIEFTIDYINKVMKA